MQTLKGKVAVVAGATRGAGRGIACMLGEAGATVYCTGRSVRGGPSPIKRPETIEETAEMVTTRGGLGIWAQIDHTQPSQVKALFERVRQEQDGRLDILVNDISGDWNFDKDILSGKRRFLQSHQNLRCSISLFHVTRAARAQHCCGFPHPWLAAVRKHA